MMIGNALGIPLAATTVNRSDAQKTAEENRVHQNLDPSAQFAAFLTMIVGNNPKLRSDLQKQLPDDSAGLLDRLLASTSDSLPDMPSAVDAARYGMLTEGALGTDNTLAALAGATSVTPSAQTPGAPAPAKASDADHKLTRAEINAINRAKVADVLASMQNGGATELDELNPASAQGRFSQSTLSRVTARKSPSLEELLAVRDHAAASVRVGIDNVLAKSGTEEGLSLAAAHAANAALSAALAASANDVTTPIKDVAALDPELRNRLERVIDRMKTEYGHDVTVVETARSQQRQDSLFAQGRTTPGSVVTWTEDSLHTQGEAVDVLVDNSWNNAKGFARLQQVAKEEGLQTLGQKDPGHLELPKDAWTLNADVRVTSASNSGWSATGVARVASVARVATVGNTMNIGPTVPETPAVVPSTISTNGAAGLLGQPRSSSGNTNSQSSSQFSSDTSGDTSADTSSRKSALKSSISTDAPVAGPAYQQTPTDLKKFIGPVDETLRPSGASAADAVDRVHDINAMREQQGAKPLSQMTLEVENGDGTTQQIRMDVRGKTVDTHIIADGSNADRLRANVNELRTGLENRGLEADSVRISTQNTRPSDAIENTKHAGIERDAMRLGGTAMSGGTGSGGSGDQSAQQGAREKSSTARDWDDKQAARDEQRAQNRDAQGRGSGNQDRQRPQYQEQQ